MPLYWSDTDGIALALHTAYPDADRLSFSRDDIIALVKKIPDFADNNPAPEKVTDRILWSWMRLAHEGVDSLAKKSAGSGG